MSVPRTPSQTVGPFFSIGLCRRAENELLHDGTVLEGYVLDGRDAPVPDAIVELSDGARWGRSPTDPAGRFSFRVARPAARGAGEAPRFDVLVFARGLLRHQLTRVYLPDEEEANAADTVLASLPAADRATLVASTEGDRLRFDIRMQGDRSTTFFAH